MPDVNPLNTHTWADFAEKNKKMVFALIISILLFIVGLVGALGYIINKNGLRASFGGVHIELGPLDTLYSANSNAKLIKQISTQLAEKISDPVERDKYLKIAGKAGEVIERTEAMKNRMSNFSSLPPQEKENLLHDIALDYGLSSEIASQLNFGIVDKYIENDDLKNQLEELQRKYDEVVQEREKWKALAESNAALATKNGKLYIAEKHRADSLSTELSDQRDSTTYAKDVAFKNLKQAKDATAKKDSTEKILEKTLPFTVASLIIEKTKINGEKKMTIPAYKLKKGIKGIVTLKELTNKVDLSSKKLEIVISANSNGGILPVSDPYIVPIAFDTPKSFQISAKDDHNFSHGQYNLDLYLISGPNHLSIYHIELIVK